MRRAAVHERDFFHAGFDGGDGAVHFGDHALVHDAGGFEAGHFGGVEMRDERGRIFEIAHQSGHVAHEDEPLCVERDCAHRGGDVGVAVVNLAILAARGRADDGRVAAPDALFQRRDIHFSHLADVTDVNFPAGIVLVVEVKFFAFENVRAGETDRLATERVDGFDDFGIDLARKHVIHNFYRGFVGDALALDEIRDQSGFFHRPGDGLSAAVDDDRIDFHRLKKDDVARDAGADAGIGRVHETAAVFHDKRLAAEFLDVGQRLEQCRRFGNQILHAEFLAGVARDVKRIVS